MDRLLAKSANILACILAKRAAITTASNPSTKKSPTFMANKVTSEDSGQMRLSLHVPTPKPPKSMSRVS